MGRTPWVQLGGEKTGAAPVNHLHCNAEKKKPRFPEVGFLSKICISSCGTGILPKQLTGLSHPKTHQEDGCGGAGGSLYQQMGSLGILLLEG